MMSYIKKILSFVLFVIICYSCNDSEPEKLFTKLSYRDTNVKFKNIIKETEEFNVLKYGYIYNGGGVAVGDLNNDGLPDIYFTGNLVGSRLYLNKGNLEFEDIAEKAGVFAAGYWNTGTTFADVNADGYLDIYVCKSAAKDPNKRKNQLFINNGDLTFTEKASEYGIADPGYSTQGSFFDYDNDGDLDLYVLNHSTQEYAGFSQITKKLKKQKNLDFSDKLYRNDNGKFTNVSEDVGLVSNVLGFGLGIAVSDINNDGWLDFYVSNDFNEQDYLYLNNQDGTFKESLQDFIGHVSLYSMGSDIADINNDGYTDIMTLDMLPESNTRQKMVSGPDNYNKYAFLVKSGFYNQTMRNMLQLNNQGEHFSEIGQFSGVSNTDWSWASLFSDFDNDGYKDLFITNGYKKDYTNMDFINYVVQDQIDADKSGRKPKISDILKKMPSTVIENYTYKNNGDLTFSKVSTLWGLDQKSLSNGAAYADLDNDGDLDLIVNNLEQEAFIYRNNSEKLSSNNYLKIKLKGNDKNTFGIGTKVEVLLNKYTLTQELIPVRGFQSSVDYDLIFGLGNQDTIKSVTVTWPNTKVQTLHSNSVNQTLILHQEEAKIVPKEEQEEKTETIFKDVTQDSLISFKHKENDFVDFNRELLLPHKLSTQGPKIVKGDVNGDGLEDIFIGGAKGQSGKLFIQTKSTQFKTINNNFDKDKMSEDVGVIFFDADNDKDLDLYVVSGGNDYTANDAELQDRLYFNNGNGQFTKSENSLPEMLTSGSCVTFGDFDNDNDLDLFIGGRVIPNKYPYSPKSYILENDGNGNFTEATAKVNSDISTLGMVTDAVWSDFNGDKKADLIVVGEWMGIRVFNNINGKLVDITNECGTKDTEGWWNTITPGDFDNDGDIDYVIGNFGLNSQLKTSIDEPVTLYAKDFDNNGSIDPVLCSYIQGESYPVYSKDDMSNQLNMLKAKYLNYADFSNQKIDDIFTEEQLKGVLKLKAVNFNTSYLENLGNNLFKIKALPNALQFSPIYSMIAQDINKDGYFDIMAGGNFFGSRVKFGKYDANKGSYLLGDGKGNFTLLPNKQSGLNVSGEVRDIINIEQFNGQKLILFTKNNESLQVYSY